MNDSEPAGGAVRLSLCMIVRDSSRTLPACLESIRPWVDEMVVVDTGSKDNTPEIAAGYGARVFHFPWCDDFARARNESIAHARGSWVFWMDSDDTITPENGRKLRELADKPPEASPVAYIMQVHCPGPDVDGRADVTVVDHVKMFRNLPELRFECRIHEQILPAIRRIDGEIAWTDIYVVHSGSDHTPAGRKAKQDRDLRLLKLELRDKPDHPFALFNLGMTYADMGDFEQAAEALARSLEISHPRESHVRKAYALLINALTQQNRHDEAANICRQGRAHYPEDAELLFREAMLAHHFGNLDNAIELYLSALDNTEAPHFASIDRGITGYKTRHNLAIVYHDAGRHDLAELQWRQAIEEVPTYRPAWRGLGRALVLQNKLTTATLQAEELAASDSPQLACEAQLIRYEIAMSRGDLCEARRALDRATENCKADEEALRSRCRFLFEHGELAEAEEALLTMTQVDPTDGAAFHNLGTLYMRMHRYTDAAEAYQTSLLFRPESPATQQGLKQAICFKGNGETR